MSNKVRKLKSTKKQQKHGPEIKVIGGSYADCIGYLETTANKKKKYANVLLFDDDDNLVQKRVSWENVKEQGHNHEAHSLFECALMTVPKLEKKFRSLFMELAKIADLHNDQDETVEHVLEFVKEGLGTAMELHSDGQLGWTHLDTSSANKMREESL